MTLDVEDVKALHERMAAQGRLAYAGGLRMLAVTLRSQAELLVAQSRTLDDTAAQIEEGREEVPDPPLRLKLVPDGPVGEGVPEDDPERAGEPGTVEPLTIRGEGLEARFVAPEGAPLSSVMAEWLDGFDDRIVSSPHFVTAVNEAAEGGRILDERTARLVAVRVSELREQARRSGV